LRSFTLGIDRRIESGRVAASVLSQPCEVGVLEAIALEAVEPGVGQPHQAQRQDQSVFPPPEADIIAGRGVAWAEL